MILSDVSVRRPVFATVMSLMLVAFGILFFGQLPVREMPDIDRPVVSINTVYSGASSRVVENRITRIIEDRIAGIEGVKSIQSNSRDGASSVTVEFDLGRDIDIAANDIRERVGQLGRFLPEEADPPEVRKVNSDERAIMWLTLASPVMDTLQLSDYADRNIIDRLSVIEGVARIQIGGDRRYAMRIWLDRTEMAARRITVTEVEQALRRENIELPAGRLESTERDFSVRVERSYGSPADFEAMVIAEGADGHLITLGELARVEIGPVNEKSEFRGDGTSNIGIGIIKQSTANTLAVAQGVKAEADRIREGLPPSLELFELFDTSVFVETAIEEVYTTLFIAVGLVILVIYLFLGSARAAIIPAITVPVCLIGTFMALGIAGFSINLLTLLALVLTIGLVVDDSIVVLENIYRRIENGEPALLASYRGARQVSFAVIATTLVVVGVFMPVIFIEGSAQRLVAELALTLTAAVGISTFVALSLSPMLCSKLLSRRATKTWLHKHMDSWFEALAHAYARSLKASMRGKSAILIALFASLALIYGFAERLPQELTPQEDRGTIFIAFRGPDGMSFPAMRREVLKIEQIMMNAEINSDVKRMLFRIPGFRSNNEVNSGIAFVTLKDWDIRERSTTEITGEIRELIRPVTDITSFVRNFGSFGGGSGTPVQVVIGANTYEELVDIREFLLSRTTENAGLVNVDIAFRQTQPQVELRIDRQRAADLGVPVESIGRTLETLLGGRRITTYLDRGEEYDVMLQAAPSDRASATDIENIYVRSARSGQLIPLSNLVSLTETAESPSLMRYNRIRALELTASLAPGYSLGEALVYLEGLVISEIPNSTAFSLKGESREFDEAGAEILFTFLVAIAVVYLILAAQFESFVHPFVIMLTVPLAIAGGLFGLWVTAGSLNIYSQVGMIILVGLASKNGILIVEFANQLRDAGRTVEEAVLEASEIRLRPILMTGLSTAFGTLPLVLATGPGSVSRASIGIVIMFGVTFSTFFTLYVIPVFYRVFAPYTSSPGTIARLLTGQESRHREIVGENPAE